MSVEAESFNGSVENCVGNVENLLIKKKAKKEEAIALRAVNTQRSRMFLMMSSTVLFILLSLASLISTCWVA